MTVITASMVKELREKTGAGMMDVKNALEECKGDLEAAADWLRAKGLAKAAKKSGRTAAEGVVAVAVSDKQTSAAVVEINSETDFVARNEAFQAFVKDTVSLALNAGDSIETLGNTQYGNGKTVAATLTELIATIGENMTLRRVSTLAVEQGVVASYVHNAIAPNLGKIGVLVALESSASADQLAGLGKQLAMHIAAASPEFLDRAAVTPEAAEREKNVIREQIKENDANKPADIIEKMLEGRMRKFYEEVCLTEQVYVMDGETRISQVIENASKEFGAPVKLTGFVRYVLGDGIEKEETDFAAEVAAAVNG